MGPIRPGGDNLAFLLPTSCALFYIAFALLMAALWWRAWRRKERARRVYRYEFEDRTLDRAKAVPPLNREE